MVTLSDIEVEELRKRITYCYEVSEEDAHAEYRSVVSILEFLLDTQDPRREGCDCLNTEYQS